MNVTLLGYTLMPEKMVAAAAKLCYSDSSAMDLLDGLDDEKTEKFLGVLTDMGHESPIEHASFTFAVEGVSRTLLAQLTRHRIASFSVQSQRYVRQDNFVFIIPPAIEANEATKAIFQEAMFNAYEAYNALADTLAAGYREELVAKGMSEKAAIRTAEKRAIEDARFVLPNACETKLVFTMNARSLQNFFRLRCCNRAQWEIRQLAEEMLRLCAGAAPALFQKSGPPCCCGTGCPEGKFSCGDMEAVRARIEVIRHG